jgi:hypothetical protein
VGYVRVGGGEEARRDLVVGVREDDEWRLAEQMAHAPAMTIGTYTHVIRELKGEPMVPAEEQIQRAREERPGRFGDADPVGAGG